MAIAASDFRDALDRAAAEASLYEFIGLMWSAVEGDRFRGNWHIEAICEHLEAVIAGEIRRLVINVPPRTSKSLTCNVFFPAWTWAQPTDEARPLAGARTRFLFASHAYDLSVRDSVKCRTVIESDAYRHHWGDRFAISRDQNAKHRYRNDRTGERLSTSMEGKITGEGGHLVLMDDPHQPDGAESDTQRASTIDAWRYKLSTRLNDPKTGAFVLIMQRLHAHDLAGFVLDQGGWTHLCLPMEYEPDHPQVWARDPRRTLGELLWPAHIPATEVDEFKRTLGTYGYAGQHQQRPAPRSGGMFDRNWWQFVPAAPAGARRVRGWDLAGTETNASPYTCGLRMSVHAGRYYIEDVNRFRGSPGKVERAIRSTAERDGHDTTVDLPQDPGQAGKAQVRTLVKLLAGYNARYSPESGSKEQRAQALSAQAEAENVYLVRAPWNDEFIEEAALFPNSDYSDQIDAASRAFHRLAGPARRVSTSAPVRLVEPEDDDE